MIKIACKYGHRQRKSPPTCYVIHNTGSSDAPAAIAYYEKNEHGIAPHFAIDRSGKIYSIVDTDKIAYHVSVSKEQRDRYAGSWLTLALSWWVARWPGLRSPAELLTGSAPNASSIGIELVGSGGDCTDAQYEALSGLLIELSRSGPKLSRKTVVGHSDVNPLARSDAKGPTDPGRLFDWRRLYDAIGASAGDDQDLRNLPPAASVAVDGPPADDLDGSVVRQGPEDAVV